MSMHMSFYKNIKETRMLKKIIMISLFIIQQSMAVYAQVYLMPKKIYPYGLIHIYQNGERRYKFHTSNKDNTGLVAQGQGLYLHDEGYVTVECQGKEYTSYVSFDAEQHAILITPDLEVLVIESDYPY